MSTTSTLPPIPESRRKGGGTVGDAFSAISGFVTDLPQKYSTLKQELIVGNEQAILDSWLRLLKHLETESIPEIKQKGSSIIPEVQYSDIVSNGGVLPADVVTSLKHRGLIIVRGMVNRDLALGWKQQIRDYISANPTTTGFPKIDPQLYEIYWSPAQVAARSHPNVLQVHKALNMVWTADSDVPVALSEPLTYADRVRIRTPADKAWNVGPHIDGGSLERWEDPQYRKCYKDILKGDWEKFDAFDVSPRIGANFDLHYGPGGCSIFRSYQGWTSLSECSPGEGTLRVFPDLAATTAYTILRPLVQLNRDGEWEIDSSTPKFHGAEMGRGQELTDKDHPLMIADNFVSIPKVMPGDAVFWHCDGAHMVEGEHKGKHDSSVLYVPVVPLCAQNYEYIRSQAAAFVNGTPPVDFPFDGVGESKHFGRAKATDVCDGGLPAMGLAPFEISQDATSAQYAIYKFANSQFVK